MVKNKTTKIMAIIFMVLFMVIFLVITGRFLYIQAAGEVQNVSLDEWAKEVRTTSYILPSKRGEILDTNGMTLAYDMPTFRIYAVVNDKYTTDTENPNHVVDPDKTAQLLAPILNSDESYILERLNQGLNSESTHQIEFGSIGKDITQQKKDEILALGLPGIDFIEESTRYYPNGMFASHIIGFAREETVEIENETVIDIKGIAGIEHDMDEYLKGVDGYISYERDVYKKKLLNANEVIKTPDNGNDVYLTIDQKVQTLLEDVMTQVQVEYKPERITAIVMDPKSGEILAIGNRPSFNPNDPVNVENWYNDAISTPFEPGSTMKMFTWASAMEEGVYDGEELFQSGTYKVSNRIQTIHDHNGGRGWGAISYDDGLIRSSNVAASKLVWEKIGTDAFLEYLHAFDFDKRTGVDLPNEKIGVIQYDWPRDKLSTAFGQGSTMTPIQLMKAASAIANDGEMMKPYIIKKVVDSNNNKMIHENKPEVVGKPISNDTAKEVRHLLQQVVQSDIGTGGNYDIDSYSIAGKTGTSQIAKPDGTGYLTGASNAVHSFLGMAPANDPELMMYVSIKKPKLETKDGTEQGSVPVSYIFNNVMENSLHYLNIEPDKREQDNIMTVEMPSIVGKNPATVEKQLKANSLEKVTVVGNGNKIVKSNILEGETVLPNERVILVTDKPVMPDITEWSLRDVFIFGNLLDISIEVNGEGYIQNQSITAGDSVSNEKVLKVDLSPPRSLELDDSKQE